MDDIIIHGEFGGGASPPPPPPPPPPPLPYAPLPPITLVDLPPIYEPTVTPNNLFNESYVDVLELIGEGEIEGLKTRIPSFAGTYTQSGTVILITHNQTRKIIPKTNAQFTFTGGASADNGVRIIDSVISTTQFTVVSKTSRNISTATAVAVSNIIGLDSIFFDKVALVQPDGKTNFTNVVVQLATGTQSQQPLGNFPDIDQETNIGETLERSLNGGVKVIPILDDNVDFIKLTLGVRSLEQRTEKGDVFGTSVAFRIEYSLNTDSASPTYTLAMPESQTVISGRTSQPFTKQYGFALPSSVNGRAVRVTRLTADSTSDMLQNGTFVSSINYIITAKLAYPNSAIIGLRLNARQFNNVPQRSYWVRGLKILIPDNATVDQTNGRLIYNGVWTGNFAAATWCADPAWCLYDMLINSRYGVGQHITATQLDRWAFYSASQYCNQLVSDGRGALEPRYLLNVNINSASEAYDAIQSMLSVFRGMSYWSAGTLTTAQDRPTPTSYIYSPANVIDGTFTYSGSSARTRSTVIIVEWFNTETQEMDYEYVEDAALVGRYGIVKRDVKAVGCQSQSAANRLGRWILYSERYETDVVTFQVSIDAGQVCRPGTIIEVQDPTRAGVTLSGRLSIVNGTTITVDRNLTINRNANPKLHVLLPTGQSESQFINTINGNSSSATHIGNVLGLVQAYSTAPLAGTPYIVTQDTLQSQLFRVVSVSEQEFAYQISALYHDPNKYSNVEDGVVLQPRSVSVLTQPPDPPVSLGLRQVLYEEANQVKIRVIASWSPSARAVRYNIAYKYTEYGTWVNDSVEVCSYEIGDASSGSYTIRVTPISSLNRRGQYAELTQNIDGLLAPPGQVQNFNSSQINQTTMLLTWDSTIDLDVRVGGHVEILHTPTVGASNYNVGNQVAYIAGSSTYATVPAMTGTYMAKFVDSSNVRSTTASFISTTIPSLFEYNVVATSTQHPSFSGTISTSASMTGTYGAGLLGSTVVVNRLADSVIATITTPVAHGLQTDNGIRLSASTLNCSLPVVERTYAVTRIDDVTLQLVTGNTFGEWFDTILDFDLYPDIDTNPSSSIVNGSATVVALNTTDDLVRRSDGLLIAEYGDFDSIIDLDAYGNAGGFDAIADMDALLNNVDDELPTTITFDTAYGLKQGGTYTYSNVAPFNNLGAAYPNCEALTTLTVDGFNIGNTVDDYPILLDESVVPAVENILNWDSNDVDILANVYPYRRESDDGITWSDWFPGYRSVTSRQYQECRLTFVSSNPLHNILCMECQTTIDVPEYQLIGNDLTNPVVIFNPPFHSNPYIAITVENGAAGDYYTIGRTVVSGKTTGMTMTFYNSSGTIVNRTFDYLARGY